MKRLLILIFLVATRLLCAQTTYIALPGGTYRRGLKGIAVPQKKEGMVFPGRESILRAVKPLLFLRSFFMACLTQGQKIASTLRSLRVTTVQRLFSVGLLVGLAATTGNVYAQVVVPGAALINTVAGNGTAGETGDGTAAIPSAETHSPSGVVVDSNGNIYIADTANNRIRKITASTGIIITIAGDGTAVNTGDNGAASSAELKGPKGLALDNLNNYLYIATPTGHRVRRINLSTGIITTVAGIGAGNAGGFSGDGGAATSAALLGPSGVAVDSSGNVYIADTGNNRIRKITVATGIINTIAGGNYAGFSGDGGLASGAQLNSPEGLAMDSSDNLYIADTSNSCIREISSAGYINTVAGTGSFNPVGDGGSAINAGLDSPEGVAVDNLGNIYIADTFHHRIRAVSFIGATISTLAGDGTASFSGDTGAASSGEVNAPQGVAVDSYGNVYIADTGNNRIRVVGTTHVLRMVPGHINTVAGNGTLGFSGDAGFSTNAELAGPTGVAFDSNGNVYIADPGNNRIRKITASTGIMSTIAGDGTAVNNGDNGPAVSAELSGPKALAIDNVNNYLYVGETSQHVRRINLSTGIITAVAGVGVGYVGTFSGDGGQATSAGLNGPIGIAVDGSGNVYIADSGNNRIREVTVATGIINTIAGGNSAGFSGDTGAASSALLNSPSGVAIDSSGNIYIADKQNCRIRKITAGIISTIAGNGSVNPTGDGASAVNAGLDLPDGVAVDSLGNIYIADTGHFRIRMVAPSGTITTFAGNGTNGFSGDRGLATSAEISGPQGVAVDSSGNVYIADASNNRIRAVGSTNVATPIFSVSSGTYNVALNVFVSDGTPGAFIHCTTDGSTPTASSPYCSLDPISMFNGTIKAIAIVDGLSSAVASATYTLQVGTPTFSPAGGTYTSAQTVSISSTTPGATIYYTTDGTTPTTGSPVYSTAIPVSTSETVQAIGVKAGWTNSAGASATYTLQVPTPTFGPPAGTYASQAVTLSVSGAGTIIIYYTTDGTSPTTSSAVYSTPITVLTSETIKAFAIRSGWTNSLVGTAAYTIQPPMSLACMPSTLLAGQTTNCTATFPAGVAGSVIFWVNGTTWRTVSIGADGKATAPNGLGIAGASPIPYTVTATYSVDLSVTRTTQVTVSANTDPAAPVYSYNIVQPDGATTGYAPNGDITAYNDSVNGMWTLGYDSLNRLTSSTQGPSATPTQYGCWVYDSFGNRLQQMTSNYPITGGASCVAPTEPGAMSPNTTMVFDTSNKIIGGSWVDKTGNSFTPPWPTSPTLCTNPFDSAPCYDNAGNLTYDQSNEYLYDADGHICAVRSVDQPITGYVYNGEGQRVAKGIRTSWSCDPAAADFQVTSTYILGPDGQEMTELDVSQHMVHTNVSMSGQMIATYLNDGSGVHFQIADWLGTRRVQTDYAGEPEEHYQSQPFGDGFACLLPDNILPCSGSVTDASTRHFTGKERDAESGLDAFHYRSYTSPMGRWTSADPSGLFYADPGNPQSLNLYAYVLNNTLQFVDPDGLSWFNTDCTGQDSDIQTSLGTKIFNFARHLFGCGDDSGGGGGGDDTPQWSLRPPTSGHYFTGSFYTHQVIGLGHTGDGLDSDDTYGWATSKDFTKLDRVLVAVGVPFQGLERPDHRTYPNVHPKYLYHSITDEQYNIIRARQLQRFSPGYGTEHMYELILNSCGQNVSDDLRAAHVRGAPPRWLFIPNLDYLWLRFQAH